MRLDELKLENFKNYEAAALDLRARINCFVGLNGAGKTNLLDAVYYLCTGKSYFNSQDQQLIRGGDTYFSLLGRLQRQGRAEEIRCVVMKGRKKVIKRNDEAYTRLVDHYGEFPVVMVAPGDVELIGGGSEERRKWLDSAISLEDREYLYHLLRYDKVLQQRNAELRKLSQVDIPDISLLEVYDQMLVPLAEAIHHRRKLFLEAFLPFFQEYHGIISQENEQVSLQYESSLHAHSLHSLFQSNFRKDVLLQRTTAGIHRDDLEFGIHERPLKKFGSQGQQKTYLLALKMAQHRYMRERTGIAPLLLLDDVCERLDETRLQVLFQLIAREDFGQVFVTDSSPKRVLRYLGDKESEARLHYVAGGRVEV